jgi:hypothetical protein
VKKPKTPEPTPKSRRLDITAKAGVTEDELMADLVSEGEATNASTAIRYVQADHGELSLTHMVASLRKHGEAVNRGDLSAAERMLNSQAVALNAIFAELARRAALNMGTHLGAAESYLRLALKAQSQSRATVETLAAIKNPPVVFARQLNMANGAQQVNNGIAQTAARTPGIESAPNELSGGSYGLLPDAGTSQATSGTHPQLEPMGALDRAAHR